MKTKPSCPEEQAVIQTGEVFSDPYAINRRSFFKILGGGLAVTFALTQSAAATLAGDDVVDEKQLDAWIHINEQGLVSVFTGKAEVGQNIRTSLAQVVADELGVPMENITMVMGDTALTPYDRGTFGSLSTPYMGPQLRKAAATARELLIDMAANEWKVERSILVSGNGAIRNPNTGQAVPMGKLTQGKALLKPVDEKIKLLPVNQWNVAGSHVPKVNGRDFVTGKHKFVSDMALPGMLHGKVLRAPAYGASLAALDIDAVKNIPGAIVVRDGDFVGVAAPDAATAAKALAAIKAEWKTTPQPPRSEIFAFLKKNGQPPGERGNEHEGNVQQAWTNAPVKIEQTFQIDYIAHAPPEPRAGLATWEGNRLTVWTGTQRPFGVQEELAKLFNIAKDHVRVIQPDTGSGYGGKHTGEAGIEAARLSKAAGKPVKVVWTREEEFTWAYFRPAGVIEVKAGAAKDGVLASWEFHNYNSGPSGIETPYAVANRKIQFHPVESPLRQGSYRGLAATANTFARECIMNDLAEALKIEPLAFRLKNLREQRMIDVLEAAATKFGWQHYKAVAGRGIGIACGTEKGSFVATCAEVEITDSDVKVVRAVVAFECGAIINPPHLENQIVGAVIQGLGGALFEYVDFKDGTILNAATSRYRVPRFADVPPQLDAVMLNRTGFTDIVSYGAGETPILGIAPAVRNAIANATGKKLYTLPLVPHGLS